MDEEYTLPTSDWDDMEEYPFLALIEWDRIKYEDLEEINLHKEDKVHEQQARRVK